MKQKLLISLISFLLMSANALFAQAPTEAAPAPGYDAANVLSVYSDDYTAVAGVDLTQSWDANVVMSSGDFSDDNYLKLTNLGMKPIYLGTLNATGMEYLHIDIWPETDIYWMRIQFQNWNDGSDDYDISTTLTANTWNSVNIPLSALTNVPVNAINVFTFFGPDDKPTIYVDNMYFYKTSSTPPAGPQEAASVPTADVTDVMSVFSNAYSNMASSFADWSQQTVTSVEQIGTDDIWKFSNTGHLPIDLGEIDVSAMTRLHADVWADAAVTFDWGLNGGGNNKTVSVNHMGDGKWLSVDIPLSSYSDVIPLDKVNFIILLNCSPTGATLYFDNVYFYKEIGLAISAPDSGKENTAALYSLNNAVRIESKESIARIEIMTVSGQLINQIDAAGSCCVIETAELTKGIYLLRVKTATGKDNILKYIK